MAPAELPEPFSYRMTFLNGDSADVAYTREDMENGRSIPMPQKRKADCVPLDPEWDAWLAYDTQKAAELHYARQDAEQEGWLDKAVRHVINKCISQEDRRRILLEDDVDAIMEAALVPEVTHEMLRDVISRKYRASFDGENVVDALEALPSGSGEVRIIRLWERELQMKLGKSLEEYGMLPASERADMLVAMKLPEWMSALESEKMRRERR
ncbi:MAG: hypothetical protein E6R03_03365 [Hyphomicrobiaceae bacterium]|nr:MAG: hypothetical protein E6R03_03365 [Hyphomicrobiaceae bacterium]